MSDSMHPFNRTHVIVARLTVLYPCAVRVCFSQIGSDFESVFEYKVKVNLRVGTQCVARGAQTTISQFVDVAHTHLSNSASTFISVTFGSLVGAVNLFAVISMPQYAF